MKKITFLTILSILFIYINSCTGYTPIYDSSNVKFKIEDYSLKGEERLANLIYRKLHGVTLSNKNNPNVQSINFSIETIKENKPTVKNNAGKILEYKINLNSKVIITDYLTEKLILNQNFGYSTSYKVQDEHSETIKLENKNIENLVEKTYQDILVKISEYINAQ